MKCLVYDHCFPTGLSTFVRTSQYASLPQQAGAQIQFFFGGVYVRGTEFS